MPSIRLSSASTTELCLVIFAHRARVRVFRCLLCDLLNLWWHERTHVFLNLLLASLLYFVVVFLVPPIFFLSLSLLVVVSCSYAMIHTSLVLQFFFSLSFLLGYIIYTFHPVLLPVVIVIAISYFLRCLIISSSRSAFLII